MKYRVETFEGQEWGTIEVAEQSDILSTLKRDGLMEGPTYSIRHHDMYSVIFADGEMLLSAEWVTE